MLSHKLMSNYVSKDRVCHEEVMPKFPLNDYSLFDRYDRFSFSFNVLAQKMEMANIDIGLLWNVIYAVEDMLYCENKPPKSSTIFSTIIPEKNRKE